MYLVSPLISLSLLPPLYLSIALCLPFSLSVPHGAAVFLAGKGISMDTGGVNLKSAQGLPGMGRDKLGAAAVAGFVLSAARLKVQGIRYDIPCCVLLCWLALLSVMLCVVWLLSV